MHLRLSGNAKTAKPPVNMVRMKVMITRVGTAFLFFRVGGMFHMPGPLAMRGGTGNEACTGMWNMPLTLSLGGVVLRL